MKTTRKKTKWAMLRITDREVYRFLKKDSKRFQVPMAVLARIIIGQHLVETGYLMDLRDSSQLAADIRRLPEAARKLYVK